MSKTNLKLMTPAPLADLLSHAAVRAPRFEDSRLGGAMRLTVGTQKFDVANISESGVAVMTTAQSGAPLPVGEVIAIKIALKEGETIFEGPASVVAHRDGGITVMRFTTKMLDEGLLIALEKAIAIRDDVGLHLKEHSALPSDFLTFLHEIKTYLSALKFRVDALENEINYLSFESQASYQKAVEMTVGVDATKQLRAFSVRLFELTKTLKDRKTIALAKKVFREELSDYYKDASFLRRAWEKPLGYAGDYEMMNQIYRNQMEGKSLFGRLMHKWGINEASSKSVRYRTQYIVNKLLKMASSNRPVVVGCLASGPAREIIEFLKVVEPAAAKNFTFILMDQDGESLLNAKRGIHLVTSQRELGCAVKFVPVSVKNIIEGSEIVEQLAAQKFSFIYTMGLYDYLKQPVAKLLTQVVLEWVVPGGDFITGNFSVNNTTHSISEFVADWSLILRTEDEMIDLAPPELTSVKSIHVDDEGVDLFLEIVRK